MHVGTNIKKLRKSKGWSQGQFAEKIGVSQKVVCDYERQIRKPPIERLPVIAGVLGLTVEELLGTQEIKINGEDKHIHGNSRIIKLEEMFDQLDPVDQRAVLKHVGGLLAKAKQDSSKD